ncbi:MAG: FAD-dependent oxidoreductase [Candidatus Stahlbacteria bacterium]|nr:FAD-dependent oxidoreductase [Candidatus Stahlbacteria bacterium]
MKYVNFAGTAFDCIVVGGGHAGSEAALVCARMGLNTLLLTLKLDKIGHLSCNPSMGGLGKSQLIFEVDALGGEIGYATDRTGIGFKMLNTKKGPAVWSLRAQVDRNRYMELMQGTIFGTPNLTTKEEEVVELIVENPKSEIPNPKLSQRLMSLRLQIPNPKLQTKQYLNLIPKVENPKSEIPNPKKVVGVRTRSGKEYLGSVIIVTAGTFLNGLIHIGMEHHSAGRLDEPPSIGLSDSLRGLGFEMGRLKTGTSPRIEGRTIDFSKCVAQLPDVGEETEDRGQKTEDRGQRTEDRGQKTEVSTCSYNFSHRTVDFNPPAVPCYLTHTNKRTP